MKCSINKKYYFLLLILFFVGGLPAKSFNLDKTKPEDIIRLASYNIRTKGDKGDKAWEVRLCDGINSICLPYRKGVPLN